MRARGWNIQYLDSKDEDFILKKMKLRQLFKRCMIVILTLFIITTAWFCYLLYLGYEDSINSDIDEIETTIEVIERKEEWFYEKSSNTIVCFALILTLSLIDVSALSEEIDNEMQNDYYIVSIITVDNKVKSSGIITGKKTNNYKSNGVIMFSVVVTGTFSYDGSHATCTNATASASSKNTNWKIVSKNASKSGNTALATVTVNKCVNNVPVNTIKESVALSCDANGNLY